MTAEAVRYLREREWTMGNGQCHDCCGLAPGRNWWTPTIGHTRNCKLARALDSLGELIDWEQPNPDARNIPIWDPKGAQE